MDGIQYKLYTGKSTSMKLLHHVGSEFLNLFVCVCVCVCVCVTDSFLFFIIYEPPSSSLLIDP